MNRKLAALAVAAALGGGTVFYSTSTGSGPAGHLYMMRGLFGGDGKDQAVEFEYSRGVDVFAAKAEAVHKVAIRVDSWRDAVEICEAATAAYKRDKKPVFLGGHSMGANAAVRAAHCLDKAKVPVAFLLSFDPTPFVACVPDNVKYATSWRRSFPLDLGGGRIKRCNGSTKDISNITVAGSRHVQIDDLPSVHAGALKRIEIGLK